jgi:(2Fe-2S) ferredoxin/2-polyprenyl-3-methyl-5-hydroxy-6-metoxy-1,4-benzoquinol methylase
LEPFRFHVFVCNQQKSDGAPCCYANGSAQVIETLRREIATNGLEDEVQVTVCGSLGLCERGPNMVVYPEGIWYSGVTVDDVPEIVEWHFRRDTPVERLIRTDALAMRGEVLNNRDKVRAAIRARESAGILPDDLNARIRAFQESRAILTALELDIFTAVGEHATAAEVAAKVEADPRATEMLLHALTAIGLLLKQGQEFRNSPVAARFLGSASPDSARRALLHTANLWKTWSTLTDCVRAGTAVAKEVTGGRRDEWIQTFIAGMHRNAMERADPVVRAVGPVTGRMLDVGGGSGAYSIAFAQANPQLEVDMIDQPQVEPIARAHVREAGLEGRVHVGSADLRSAQFGEGYDLAFVSAICHMLSPEENLDLIRRCFGVLAPGGRIVIQDFILDPEKTAPRAAALFALNMLTGTAAGSTYSEPEYTAWLEAAGFHGIRHVKMAGSASLMLAVRE